MTRPDGSNPDSFYFQVADAYRDIVRNNRKVAVVLAEEADVPVGTVHRWILESRRRGFLPQPGKGAPDEQAAQQRRGQHLPARERRPLGGALTYADDQGKRRQRVVASGKRRADVAAKLKDAHRRLEADEPVRDARTTVGAFVEDRTRKALPASVRKLTTQAN